MIDQPAPPGPAPVAYPHPGPKAPSADPSPELPTEPHGDPPRRRRWLVPVLLGALVLTSVTAGTFAALWLKGGGGPDAVNDFIAETSPAAEDTARRVVDILMNYDSTNLEDRRKEMLELSTGKFRDEYDEFTEQLGAALEETKASSRGQLIGDPNIAFRSPSQAIAIMRATQTTQSSENPGGRTLEYVLEVTLLDTAEEGWKADSVEILSETRS